MIGQFQHGETVGCDSNNAGEKDSTCQYDKYIYPEKRSNQHEKIRQNLYQAVGVFLYLRNNFWATEY